MCRNASRSILTAAVIILCAGNPADGDIIYDFSTGDDGGFASSGTGTTNWTFTGFRWEAPGENGTISFLTSSVLTATASSVNLTINHVYNFQNDLDFVDGGVVELSINGGEFNVVTPAGGYPTGSLIDDGVDTLGFIPGWGGDSGGTVTDSFELAVNSGDKLQFRFHGAWDSSLLDSSPNWSISSVTLDNVTATPESGSAILLFCSCCGLSAVHQQRRLCRRSSPGRMSSQC